MDKIKKILNGTNNPGKYKEICELLPKEITKHSTKEFKISPPEETGNTYADNALIKAKYYSLKTSLICLADDSGLEIDLLNGKPGIHSARWAEKSGGFDNAILTVFDALKKAKADWSKKIVAEFICCLAIWWPQGKFCSHTGGIKGKISPKKRGAKGFGYDPIFIPDGYNQAFGEMEPEFKMSIDHRFSAFSQIKKYFI